MRQRVLTIMGLAVGLLVIYTLFFGTGVGQAARAGGGENEGLSGRLRESVAAQSRRRESRRQAQSRPAETPAARDATPAATETRPRGEAEPVVWGSDPFVRDWVLTDELRELDLKAITIGGDRAYALLNDQILEEGDVIGGRRIVTIDTDKVILEQGGRRFTLMLGE